MTFHPHQNNDDRVWRFVRFMTFVSVDDQPTGCWEWCGGEFQDRGGYGRFSVGGKGVRAHRWLYEFIHGEQPDDLVIRHQCDNPKCVNPAHLVAGTHAQNTHDMFAKGRNPDRRGERHPLARLTPENVLEIRRLASMGHTHHALAESYGMSRQHIGKIVRRENWGHL